MIIWKNNLSMIIWKNNALELEPVASIIFSYNHYDFVSDNPGKRFFERFTLMFPIKNTFPIWLYFFWYMLFLSIIHWCLIQLYTYTCIWFTNCIQIVYTDCIIQYTCTCVSDIQFTYIWYTVIEDMIRSRLSPI